MKKNEKEININKTDMNIKNVQKNDLILLIKYSHYYLNNLQRKIIKISFIFAFVEFVLS